MNNFLPVREPLSMCLVLSSLSQVLSPCVSPKHKNFPRTYLSTGRAARGPQRAGTGRGFYFYQRALLLFTNHRRAKHSPTSVEAIEMVSMAFKKVLYK